MLGIFYRMLLDINAAYSKKSENIVRWLKLTLLDDNEFKMKMANG